MAGEPSMDLRALDSRRFGRHHMGERFLRERCAESYARYYAIRSPLAGCAAMSVVLQAQAA